MEAASRGAEWGGGDGRSRRGEAVAQLAHVARREGEEAYRRGPQGSDTGERERASRAECVT
jgi:hypothetical protein